MVENAYKVTLVAAFIPLFAGLYWKRANTHGALFAVAAGLITWIALEVLVPLNSVWPPQFVGFLMAGAGMIVGSLLPRWLGHAHAPTHHAATHHAAVHPPHHDRGHRHGHTH